MGSLHFRMIPWCTLIGMTRRERRRRISSIDRSTDNEQMLLDVVRNLVKGHGSLPRILDWTCIEIVIGSLDRILKKLHSLCHCRKRMFPSKGAPVLFLVTRRLSLSLSLTCVRALEHDYSSGRHIRLRSFELIDEDHRAMFYTTLNYWINAKWQDLRQSIEINFLSFSSIFELENDTSVYLRLLDLRWNLLDR